MNSAGLSTVDKIGILFRIMDLIVDVQEILTFGERQQR